MSTSNMTVAEEHMTVSGKKRVAHVLSVGLVNTCTVSHCIRAVM